MESTLAMSLTALSFMLTVIWGGPLLKVLRHFKVGKIIRVEEPEKHMVKMGTPTMGGVMFIAPVVLLTILLNAAQLFGLTGIGKSVLVPLIVMVSYGILGAIDDWQGIRGKRKGEGMRIRTKFIAQWAIAIGAAMVVEFLLDVPDMYLPGLKFEIELNPFIYIAIASFIIVACSNAVNFTDGLDGLAGMISATIFAAYGAIALFQGQIYVARFCFTIVGALFGFLWFNVHPAELIMGDTGALALGGAMAMVTLMTGQWPLFLLIGVIPVAEALSVTIQIFYFKATKGRRFFKMAPLHLHFEMLGWSETQIVQRFWLIGLLVAMIGIGFALV